MTKSDRQHMANVQALGCIVCLKTGRGNWQAEVHHILRNGRRIDHRHTIPLCVRHHRTGENTDEIVSRHPWKREFEKRYGTETELLELTQAELSRVNGGAA